MTTPTTIDTETELSAVNTILGAIGQSPVTTLGTVTTNVTNTASQIANTFENPEIALYTKYLKNLILMYKMKVGHLIERIMLSFIQTQLQKK